MVKNEQDKKSDGKKRRVQRVLDYHNEKHGAHITIEGKTQDVRPDLKGKSDWDWVCYDTETGDEVAIEVKRFTDSTLEQKGKIIWQILEEVRDSLSGKLPGNFRLYANIPNGYHPPIGQKNKQQLEKLLCEVICKTAPRLQIGEQADLRRRIKLMLRKAGKWFYIPQTLSCILLKISNGDSLLTFGSGLTYWKSPEVKDAELKEFEKLVSKANKQLQRANVKETFWVLIKGHSGIEPAELAKAFKSIKKSSYSGITHVYFVSGSDVTEIPLPTS